MQQLGTRSNRIGKLPFSSGDLRGMARLAFDATLGVVDVVEAMHHTIASGAGIFGKPRAGATSGITGAVYRTIRGTTRLTGSGFDAAWRALLPDAAPPAGAPEREAVLAALNGVWGDHLERSGNPLAIRMAFRSGGETLHPEPAALRIRYPAARPKLIVLLHGLCMNDMQWNRQGDDQGQALAAALGANAVYLHYNSGRHVSQNGEEFSDLLERLVRAWPVELEDVVIIGHSMGGLVARSACHHAGQTGAHWLSRLRALVFLGTPHHGAPLERGGRLVDAVFGLSPYVAPLGRLGRARSAGITDLRYGNLRHEDWQHRDRHGQTHDDRVPTPLPESVPVYLVAATLSGTSDGLHASLLGDGLVPLPSALGEHPEPQHALRVPLERQYVATSASHFDLLSRADVYDRLRGWLAA